MRRKPVSADEADELRIGSFFFSLLEDRSWLLRRVETVHFLDRERVERRVSIDLDCAEIRRRASSLGLNRSKISIPVTMLPKGLLLDFDIADSNGSRLPMATSARNSEIATAVLLASVAGSKFRRKKLPLTFRDELLRATSSNLAGSETSDRLLHVSEDSRPYWEEFSNISYFTDYLTRFYDYYMIIVELHSERDSEVIKYRQVETSQLAKKRGFWAAMGIKPVPFRIPLETVKDSKRQHIRIVAPADTQLVTAFLESATSRSPGNATFQRRIIAERASFYVREAVPGLQYLYAAMRPSVGGFCFPALLSVGACLVLLVFGAYFEIRYSSLSQPDDNVSFVPVLLLLPSLISAYLARLGEHDLVTRLLFWPRILVLIAAFSALLSGGAIALGVPSCTLERLLVGSSIICCLTVILLFFVAILSHYSERRVSERGGKTFTRQLRHLPKPSD